MEVFKTQSVREEETNISLLTEESAESSDDEEFVPNPELEEDSEETKSDSEDEDMAATHVSKRNEMDIEEVALMAETSGVKDLPPCSPRTKLLGSVLRVGRRLMSQN